MGKGKQMNKWLLLVVICLGGGIIYIFPYIQYSYYDSMMAEMGLSNVQMGNLMSLYGALNLIGYFFGGMVAAKTRHRPLMPDFGKLVRFVVKRYPVFLVLFLLRLLLTPCCWQFRHSGRSLRYLLIGRR